MSGDTALPPWVAGVEHRMHELDPELTEEQIGIARSYGNERSYDDGEMVWQAGDRDAGWVVVLDGHLEIVDGDRVIITHGRGHYGGEIVTMAGMGAVVGGRAKGQTRVIQVAPDNLRSLLALETGLSEMLITSFIVRRMRMLSERQGGLTLIGDPEESETAHIRTFLSRQGIPFTPLEGADIDTALDEHKLARADLPAVRLGDDILVKPTILELAQALGVAAELDDDKVHDLIVLGGGPSGLAAAVYGASEGLDVLVVEALAPGGQAGTSSRIENYLGFPTGISGQGLAGRAFLQATKFGAQIAFAREVTEVRCGTAHEVVLDGKEVVRGRFIVVATGAVYREPPVDGLDRFNGGGVHYGASFLEAQLCRGKNVAIIGGGNSAGQAAIYLADQADSVTIYIRSADLSASMSRYLIDRIESAGNISVAGHTEVIKAHGETKLEALTLKDNRDQSTDRAEINHLFVFIGAVPASDFIRDGVVTDDNGFIITGDQLTDDQLAEANWPGDRKPYHLETSCPGIFAVGDVRAGSVKRVASAVGEGSVCIQYVHRLLADAADAQEHKRKTVQDRADRKGELA